MLSTRNRRFSDSGHWWISHRASTALRKREITGLVWRIWKTALHKSGLGQRSKPWTQGNAWKTGALSVFAMELKRAWLCQVWQTSTRLASLSDHKKRLRSLEEQAGHGRARVKCFLLASQAKETKQRAMQTEWELYDEISRLEGRWDHPYGSYKIARGRIFSIRMFFIGGCHPIPTDLCLFYFENHKTTNKKPWLERKNLFGSQANKQNTSLKNKKTARNPPKKNMTGVFPHFVSFPGCFSVPRRIHLSPGNWYGVGDPGGLLLEGLLPQWLNDLKLF